MGSLDHKKLPVSKCCVGLILGCLIDYNQHFKLCPEEKRQPVQMSKLWCKMLSAVYCILKPPLKE